MNKRKILSFLAVAFVSSTVCSVPHAILFSKIAAAVGLTSINADTTAAQLITTDSAGTDVSAATAGGTTTISVPSASAANRGVVTIGSQTLAGVKTFSSAPVLSSLTASLPICTSAGKAASSTCAGLIPWADIVTGNNYRLIATGAAGVPAEVAAITASKGLCSDANGIPVACTSGPSTTEMGYVTGLTSAAQTQIDALKVQAYSGMIAAGADGTYTIDLFTAYAGTINTLKIITDSGTATAAVKINGTNVTGISAVSVSSSIATGTASAANTFSAGDKITLVLSSSSSPVNLAFTLKYTR